jgi:hypothetical protein
MAYQFQIWKEQEQLRYKNISRSLLNNLKRLGFTGIVSHSALLSSRSAIENKIDPGNFFYDGSVDGVPFRTNTIYLYCQSSSGWGRWAAKSECPLTTTLKPPITINLMLAAYEEGVADYYHFCSPTFIPNIADVLFEGPRGACGWYNIKKNILWLPDLTHTVLNKYFTPVIDSLIAVKNGNIATSIVDSITFGADPEFEIFDTHNNHIPANTIFSTQPRIPIGCDGLQATGELRPRPSPSPLGVVRNIRRLCHQLASDPRLKTFTITSGGGQIHHLGGHIHVNKYISTTDSQVLWDVVGKPVLDGMTGLRTLRADLILRDSPQAVRLPSQKDRANHSGSEWRQLPSWIESEKAAKAIMCTFAAVYKHHLTTPYNPNITMAITDRERGELLRGTSLYKCYAKYIEDFISLFCNSKYSMEGRDIFPGWNISKDNHATNLFVTTDRLIGIEKFFPPVYIKELSRSLHIELLLNRDSATDIICTLPKNIFDNRRILGIIAKTCDKLANSLLTTTEVLYHRKGDSLIELWYPGCWKKVDRAVIAARIAPFIKTFIKTIIKGG